MDCPRCGADNLTDLPVCPSCAREIHISYERQKMLRQIYGVSTNTSTISAPMPNKEEIAAAPEMLELLQRIREEIDYGCNTGCTVREQLKAINAVIAKATGKEETE